MKEGSVLVEKENALFNENPLFPFRIALQGVGDKKLFSLPHWHEYMELIYVVKESILVSINGEKYTLQEGDIAFLGGHTVHSTDKKEDLDSVAFVLYFDSSLISMANANVLETKYIKSFLGTFGSKYNYKIIRNEKKKVDLSSVLAGMYHEYMAGKSAYDLFIKGYIYQMIALLIREKCVAVMPENYKQEHVRQVEKSLKYIEENYSRDITLQRLAEECNVSYHYFSKIFKQVTGKNYKEYIDYVRVTEAEKLMLTNRYSVSEVSYKVGISDQSCFYRLYKRVRGCSPTEFKAKMKYI